MRRRKPSIARIAGGGGKRRAMAFRGTARGLRAAGHTLRSARLPRAAGGHRAHGRVAAGTASIAQAASQTIARDHSPTGASAAALLTRVVCDPIPGASRPETQYGWPSRSIQLKAFLIERNTHGRPHWRAHHLPCRHPGALSRQHAADRRPRKTDRARNRDHPRRHLAAEISRGLLGPGGTAPAPGKAASAPVALQRCVTRPIATTPRHAALFTLV